MKRCSWRRAVRQWVILGGTFVHYSVGQTPVPEAMITVRLDTVGPASEREVIDMERSATSIFRHAGLDVRWLDCWALRARCDALDGRAAAERTLIRLRIVEHLDRAGVHTLGWTAQGSSAATVQYRRAQQIAYASTIGVSPGLILGHVAAHEIGHILLRSSTHNWFGVMKASYSARDLSNMVQGRLLFTDEESRSLRAWLGKSIVKGNAEVASSRF